MPGSLPSRRGEPGESFGHGDRRLFWAFDGYGRWSLLVEDRQIRSAYLFAPFGATTGFARAGRGQPPRHAPATQHHSRETEPSLATGLNPANGRTPTMAHTDDIALM